MMDADVEDRETEQVSVGAFSGMAVAGVAVKGGRSLVLAWLLLPLRCEAGVA